MVFGYIARQAFFVLWMMFSYIKFYVLVDESRAPWLQDILRKYKEVMHFKFSTVLHS